MSQVAGKFKCSLPERIFDCFVTVELQLQMDDHLEHVVPVISYGYPATASNKKDGTMACIPQFCFPVIEKEPKSKMERETFSFVLTESDGTRRFGYCRQFLAPGNGKRFPQCFCIILDEVELRWFSTGKTVITPLLEAILGSKFPLPGQSIELTVVSYKQAGVIETLLFTRPNDEESTLDFVNFTPLLQLVTPENILSVFASLLIERRVIFVSERLSTLSNCVQACVALLYPFIWQHVYIPVLPTSLLTMCCAPMPFVVGILSSSLTEVLRLPLDDVLILDIDHNKFPLSSGNDVSLLPPQEIERLYDVLKYAAKLVKRTTLDGLLSRDDVHLSKKDSSMLTKEFARFFATLLSGYWRFFVTGPNAEFDHKSFLEASLPECTQLLEWMLQGQMFERWIEEKRACSATAISECSTDRSVSAEKDAQIGASGSSSGVLSTHSRTATTVPDASQRPSSFALPPLKPPNRPLPPAPPRSTVFDTDALEPILSAGAIPCAIPNNGPMQPHSLPTIPRPAMPPVNVCEILDDET